MSKPKRALLLRSDMTIELVGLPADPVEREVSLEQLVGIGHSTQSIADNYSMVLDDAEEDTRPNKYASHVAKVEVVGSVLIIQTAPGADGSHRITSLSDSAVRQILELVGAGINQAPRVLRLWAEAQ